MPAQFNVPANPTIPMMVEIVTTCDVAETNATTQRIVNVWHLSGRGGNPGMVDFSTLGNSFVNSIYGLLAPVLSVDYTGATATIRVLDDPTALPINLTDPADGTVSGDRLPTLASASFDLVTDARGRCFRGRKHFAPIAESQTTKDELSGAAIILWADLESALNGGISPVDGNGNTYDLCVLSRKNSNLVGPSISFTFAKVTAGIVSAKIGTMKRRKEGVGV